MFIEFKLKIINQIHCNISSHFAWHFNHISNSNFYEVIFHFLNLISKALFYKILIDEFFMKLY